MCIWIRTGPQGALAHLFIYFKSLNCWLRDLIAGFPNFVLFSIATSHPLSPDLWLKIGLEQSPKMINSFLAYCSHCKLWMGSLSDEIRVWWLRELKITEDIWGLLLQTCRRYRGSCWRQPGAGLINLTGVHWPACQSEASPDHVTTPAHCHFFLSFQ